VCSDPTVACGGSFNFDNEGHFIYNVKNFNISVLFDINVNNWDYPSVFLYKNKYNDSNILCQGDWLGFFSRVYTAYNNNVSNSQPLYFSNSHMMEYNNKNTRVINTM
jgi:hypothetical protein